MIVYVEILSFELNSKFGTQSDKQDWITISVEFSVLFRKFVIIRCHCSVGYSWCHRGGLNCVSPSLMGYVEFFGNYDSSVTFHLQTIWIFKFKFVCGVGFVSSLRPTWLPTVFLNWLKFLTTFPVVSFLYPRYLCT